MSMPTETYILPDVAWACLLDAITRDAKPGANLITCTEAMRDLCEQTLAGIGREDVTVDYRPEGMTKNRTEQRSRLAAHSREPATDAPS